MAGTAKLAEDTPCCDSGSVLKWWFNPGVFFRTPNRSLKNNTPAVVVGSGAHCGDGTTAFVRASTKKLLYFSYRNCFSPLPNGCTTDTRWGCLVRTTQMLIGAALLRYHSDGAYVLPEEGNVALKATVSRLFMDVPTAPLGIHRVEAEAHKNNVKYASMLAPTEAGTAMAAALAAYHADGGDVPYTFSCEDRNIDEPAVLAKLAAGQRVLLVIPVVLGITPMSDKYETMLLKILDMTACCGAAGGYKEASFYMFGHQGRNVFFLDPHFVQSAYKSEKTAGHLGGARGDLIARRFDPCMVLGFYLHTPEDYRIFAEELAVVNAIVVFPLISVTRQKKEESSPSDCPAATAAAAAEVPTTPPPHDSDVRQGHVPNPLVAATGAAHVEGSQSSAPPHSQ
ncbi:AUT2/APG4/ATG4 cysteine peptidase [Novymonas esmeraldas]|uniref:Cysteine protease n=1 Tax=Novymonas esmeraldas TaxID=1808958 RepID=A0AAW0ERG6_9TRYP